jgi:hypothetical protein
MCLLLIVRFQPSAFGQNGTNPLTLFQNYFVTGDYVVSGWVKDASTSDGTYTSGTISFPDALQKPFVQNGVPTIVPKGADIVAAYLYWATVESNQSSFAGQAGFFNGYQITGKVLGNPNAPTSWSAGGCSGSAMGSKTMRTYRADVRPYLPLDIDPSSPTFGATIADGMIPVKLADNGSNGNAAPIALGASLVVIYRVLSPAEAVRLNAIVLYDGAFAPSNASQTISQTLTGFYQQDASPAAKITHIVANGQPNKGESVSINGSPLQSLYTGTYGPNAPAFPGIYGSWDDPTWNVSNKGHIPDPNNNKYAAELTSVVPSRTNSGCVSWGAIVMSTTVQDTDGDGLLDVWEEKDQQGYTDAVSGQWVALPGADPNNKDIFVEIDWLSNLDLSAGPNSLKHSHLPKEEALRAVGDAFDHQHITVHFDLGPGIYQGDPYVISYPVSIPSPLPPGTLVPQAGAGGNAISEGKILCTAALCAYPGQPAVSFKGGLEVVEHTLTLDPITNRPVLGDFQPGRSRSYHYVLFGHSLGQPRSYWSTLGFDLAIPALPQLESIVNSGNTATITLLSPQGVIKPGDCPNAAIAGCSDPNSDRVSITGALGQTALNASYSFSILSSTTRNNITTTIFTITTTGVANGTYNFTNEPQLAVTYLGPTSSSGHSDFRGGGDSIVTFGLWGADDPAGCEPDPSQWPLPAGQVYCNNEVGTVEEQIGTLLHELGHTLTLTHGGTYYTDLNNPSVPKDELNCKPNFLSVMNYLFQVRGFVEGAGGVDGAFGGKFDYSGQTLPPLNEAYPYLSESAGIGTALETGQPAAHLTRWYAAANALDTLLGHSATAHCDGTPLLPNEPPVVRVDGVVFTGGTFSAPLDWNNDLNYVTPDPVLPPGEDLNHNGIIGDAPFSGFDDWQAVNLQQIRARTGASGASAGLNDAGGGLNDAGGGLNDAGGGIDHNGGGLNDAGGGLNDAGGGIDLDEDTATSTADSPTGLTCTVAINSTPACVSSSGTFLETARAVPLSWTRPSFGQTRNYTIWRAVGAFQTSAQILSNKDAFVVLKTLTGTPPSTSFLDSNVKKVTYTYFVTDGNKQGVKSAASNPLVVTVK